MDRTPRNAGQSFSIAAAESVVVATVEVIIVVIVVGTGFPGVQAVSHIASVWLLFVATVSARLQVVVFCSSHVAISRQPRVYVVTLATIIVVL